MPDLLGLMTVILREHCALLFSKYALMIGDTRISYEAVPAPLGVKGAHGCARGHSQETRCYSEALLLRPQGYQAASESRKISLRPSIRNTDLLVLATVLPLTLTHTVAE